MIAEVSPISFKARIILGSSEARPKKLKPLGNGLFLRCSSQNSHFNTYYFIKFIKNKLKIQVKNPS